MIVPILIVQIATEKVERLFRQKLSLFTLIVVATNVLRSLKSGFDMITPVTEPFFADRRGVVIFVISCFADASQTSSKHSKLCFWLSGKIIRRILPLNIPLNNRMHLL